MKITKNTISREEAVRLAPNYVKFVESREWGGGEAWDMVEKEWQNMKSQQRVITFYDGVYIKAIVTSAKREWKNEDGPVVRVSNGEYSWRVDGTEWAYPY